MSRRHQHQHQPPLTSDFLQRLDKDSKHNIEEILDVKLGQGLLDLPRSDERNRQPNDLFRFNLHRCLRLNIWESTTPLICLLCHQDFDTKGDHLFQCAHLGRYLNTKLHHQWRDTWQSLIDRIMPLINLTNTKAKTEQTGLIRPLKNTNFAHLTPTLTSRPYPKIATTVVNSEKLDSTSSTATLTLALLPPVVEVMLNLTISLRHSSGREEQVSTR
jgi:hypothetical protein